MPFGQLTRREFVILLGGAVVPWPLAALVVGFLHASSRETVASQLVVFRQALAEAGYIEGKNVSIDYRFADGQYDRLPTLAGELVAQPVSVIITGGAAFRGPLELQVIFRLPIMSRMLQNISKQFQ